jgi:protein-S-isoprenylcysteine O-methyltransferase Ste14
MNSFSFMRYFLPVYLVLYVGAAFVWRTYMVWKQTGVNPVTFKGTDSAHDFIGRLFKLLFALIFVAVFGHAFVPDYYHHFSLPIVSLEKTWLVWLGVFLLVLSLVWTVLAQAQMGESWRIGIDREHRTSLMRSGLFSLSRNPIYLGMKLTLIGLFLVVPNVLTLLTLVLGFVLIGTQVRLEEEFLAKLHGDSYEQYRSRVARWFGRR